MPNEISYKITDDHKYSCLLYNFSYFRESLCHLQIQTEAKFEA